MPDRFAQVLAGHDPEIRRVAKRLRQIVCKAAPAAEERVQLGWRNVAWYRDGMFCYVQPQRGWVNVGWNRGAELHDPQHLLEGTGKGMRHIKVRSLKELRPAVITRHTTQAYRLQVASPKVRVGR